MTSWPFKSYFDTLEVEQKRCRNVTSSEGQWKEMKRRKKERTDYSKRETQRLDAYMVNMKQPVSAPVDTEWWPMKDLFDDKKKKSEKELHKSVPLPHPLRSAQYIYNSV